MNDQFGLLGTRSPLTIVGDIFLCFQWGGYLYYRLRDLNSRMGQAGALFLFNAYHNLKSFKVDVVEQFVHSHLSMNTF